MKKHKKKKGHDSAFIELIKPAIDHSEEIKRLNRVSGQVDGIRKMLENERPLNDVLIQFKAVHSALKSIEQRVFKNYVDECVNALSEGKRKEREARIEELLDLFKQG
jgi:DNA-binding FrmR family transcriptional regulator